VMNGMLMFICVMLYVKSYLWIKAFHKMTKYSIIQKLDRSFSAACFAPPLKPPPLQDGGSNYKTWHVRFL
jgi:hypothetical protein